MSSAETHTVETQYGPTTIETYDCDSCGNTVAYENTVPFTIGDTEGRACEHCEANGPISFPKRVVEFQPPYETVGSNSYGLVFHTLFAPLVLPFETFGGFVDDDDRFAAGYATAVVTLFVWLVVPAVLWVVL